MGSNKVEGVTFILKFGAFIIKSTGETDLITYWFAIDLLVLLRCSVYCSNDKYFFNKSVKFYYANIKML